MTILYILTGLLALIALGKMIQTWKLSADITDQKPHFVVRSFFGFFDFVANVASLKIFK